MRPLFVSLFGLCDFRAGVELRSGGVGGRGLFCGEAVAAGQELITIPHDSILDERTAAAALAAEGLPPSADEPTWPSTLTGASIVLGADAKWRGWRASWVAADEARPGAAYRWADWRDDDVAGRCAALAAEHALFTAPLLEDRARARRGRRAARSAWWASTRGDVAAFRAALPVVNSRAVRATVRGGESLMALVPGFDMLNHASSDRRNVALAPRDEGLAVRATRDLAAGDELLTCYADVDDYDADAAAHVLLTWGIPP